MKNEDRFDSGSDEDEKLIGDSIQMDEDGAKFVYGFIDLFSGMSPCAGEEEEEAHISQESTLEDSKNQASKPLSKSSSSSKDSYSDEVASNTSSPPASRYLDDFVELKLLGEGAFGSVWLCRHRIDGKEYAVKKIRIKDPAKQNRILRKTTTLSSLQHRHVVRYYQA